jgi:hypothetical protein
VGQLAPGSAPGVLSASLGAGAPGDPFAWLLEAGPARSLGWLARHRPEVRA